MTRGSLGWRGRRACPERRARPGPWSPSERARSALRARAPLASGACRLAVSLSLRAWAQGAVGGECVPLAELSFCFMGQAVSWPRWLQGQGFFVVVFGGKQCCLFFFNYFVLWYFSSLRIIFNSKTGLTAVAFLFHFFL